MAFFGLLALTGCNGSGKDAAGADSAKGSSELYEITDNALLSTNGLPMIVDFSAEWCPPCRKLKPVFDSLKTKYAGQIDMVSIDVDSMENLASHYRISSIPCLIFIAPDGTEVYRMIGYHDASEIEAEISQHLN